jgi:histidine triad (HIT) family protein
VYGWQSNTVFLLDILPSCLLGLRTASQYLLFSSKSCRIFSVIYKKGTVMADNCLFCKIAKGEIPSSKVYEDDKVFAFKDINPQAPVHIVIIPKKHISGLNHIDEEDKEILGHIQFIASKLTKQFPEFKNGFRIINNCGSDGGQTVFHIHYHLLGGRVFGWPPG